MTQTRFVGMFAPHLGYITTWRVILELIWLWVKGLVAQTQPNINWIQRAQPTQILLGLIIKYHLSYGLIGSWYNNDSRLEIPFVTRIIRASLIWKIRSVHQVEKWLAISMYNISLWAIKYIWVRYNWILPYPGYYWWLLYQYITCDPIPKNLQPNPRHASLS